VEDESDLFDFSDSDDQVIIISPKVKTKMVIKTFTKIK
jgi:hypothetical protein